jgi:hypothetical protein
MIGGAISDLVAPREEPCRTGGRDPHLEPTAPDSCLNLLVLVLMITLYANEIDVVYLSNLSIQVNLIYSVVLILIWNKVIKNAYNLNILKFILAGCTLYIN